MGWLWVPVGVLVVLGVFGVWFALRQGPPAQVARTLFEEQREHLQVQFFEAAAASGKPRGLRWVECDWESRVELARERSTRRLAALVGVTIRFQAIEGSDMEGLPAVGNLRNASAVFFFDRGQWHTTGRALFNVNPGEAFERLAEQYERLQT
jgi:hypothetical protein